MNLLNRNENFLGCSKRSIEVIKRSLDSITRYPDISSKNLENKIAKLYKIKEKNIFLGNGIDDINFLISNILDQNDSVLTHQKSFIGFKWATQALRKNINYIQFPLENDYSLCVENFCNAINKHKPKIIYLCNPNNPTGKSINNENLFKLIDHTRACKDTLLVVDEAYIEYASNQTHSSVSYIGNENIVVLRTFSKFYGLAGLRIGYAISSPKIISRLEEMRKPTQFAVNVLARIAASEAIQDDVYSRLSYKENNAKKSLLYKILTRHKLTYIESDTNFVCVDARNIHFDLSERLSEFSIQVCNLKAFDLNGYIRISVGDKKQLRSLNKALNRILE